jgi:hypothetical protein
MSDYSNSISFPGEINVLKATIISSTGKSADITTLIIDLSLFEDIFSNTMTGFVLIEDSLDLINNIPLIGQEQFIIELQTPTLEAKIVKSFYIYKLQGREVKKRSQTYLLNFCSRELIYSGNSKVSKSFTGNISDTVTSIFRDERYLASDSILTIEKTKNAYSFIAPFWSPLETINWLTGKSINEKGVPNYLFYENNQNFQYVSVDSLIQSTPIRDYIYSDVDYNTVYGSNGDKELKYGIVENIDNGVTFDYLRNLSGGMYSSKLYTQDLTTKRINTNTFDYIEDFNKSSHLEKEPLKTNTLFRKKLASLYFIHKNDYKTGSYNPQGYKDFFLQRNSLLEQLSAFKISIKVIGRTDVKVGQTINFKINELKQILGDEINTSDGASEYFGGKYLITAIRHQILSGHHSMYMEIVSDSFIKNIVTKK